jgi:hypothetical protein
LASHHSPFAQSAKLTAGVAIVTAAIGANAITTTGTSRLTIVLIESLSVECSTLAVVQHNSAVAQHVSV